MSETELQRAILKALKQAGFWAFRVNTGGRQGRVKLAPPGTPDICLVHPSGWLEVKLPGQGLTPAQGVWFDQALVYGVRAATVTSVADALAYAREWSRE